MMKVSQTIAILSIALTQAHLTAGGGTRIPEYVDRIAAIAYEKDPARAMALLEEIQTLDDSATGARVEPGDRTRLSVSALRAFSCFVPWDSAEANRIGANPNSQIQNWMRVDAVATDAILAMLGAESPVARWLACEKLRKLDAIDPRLLPKLKDMASNDDFFEIGLRPIKSPTSDADRAPNSAETVFVAMLRDEAAALLRSAGEAFVGQDDEKVAIDGLAWLGRQFIARPNDRFWIGEHLKRLAPITPAIRNAQERANEAKSDAEKLALFRSFVASASATDKRSDDQVASQKSIDSSPERAPAKAIVASQTTKEGVASDVQTGLLESSPWIKGAVIGLLLLGAFVVWMLKRR